MYGARRAWALGRRERRDLAILVPMSISGLWLVIGWLALCEAAIVVAAPRIPVRPIASRSVGGARPAEDVWTLPPALLRGSLGFLSAQAG